MSWEYGMDSSVTADIFDVKHFAVHDGPGIRTTVFFKGCPLRCVWCHNPEGISAPKQLGYLTHKCVGCGKCVSDCPSSVHLLDPKTGEHRLCRDRCHLCGSCVKNCPNDALTLYGRTVGIADLLDELLEDRIFYGETGGVTLSGGECLLQPDFCRELLSVLKAEAIHTAVDTCGFVPQEVLDRVLPYTDLFLYDIKAFHRDIHIRCTGHPNDRILENIRYLDQKGVSLEIRIPYVPGCNDGEIGAIGVFLAKLSHPVRVRVLPYHSYAVTKYASLDMPYTLSEEMPSDEEIRTAETLLQSLGLEICK